MECGQCFPSQPFVVLPVDQFVGHGGGPLERQKHDSHIYRKTGTLNVTAVEFRFWAVVLTKKLMFDKTFKKISVAGSHFSTQLLTLNYLLCSPTDAAPQFL